MYVIVLKALFDILVISRSRVRLLVPAPRVSLINQAVVAKRSPFEAAFFVLMFKVRVTTRLRDHLHWFDYTAMPSKS